MTLAQRARLVVAMGVLNLVLATVALTAGIVAPPRSDLAALPSATSTPPAPATAGASEPVPTVTPDVVAPTRDPVAPTPVTTPPTGTPSAEPSALASVAPSLEPSVPPSPEPSGDPSLEPLPPVPSEGPIVADGPTPAPTSAPPKPARSPAVARPKPTLAPATARPTPRATPKPAPVAEPAKKTKAKPPCPTKGEAPPGQRKGAAETDRPCGKGADPGKKNGIVVLLPLFVGGLVAGARGRISGAHARRLERRERLPIDTDPYSD